MQKKLAWPRKKCFSVADLGIFRLNQFQEAVNFRYPLRNYFQRQRVANKLLFHRHFLLNHPRIIRKLRFLPMTSEPPPRGRR